MNLKRIAVLLLALCLPALPARAIVINDAWTLNEARQYATPYTGVSLNFYLGSPDCSGALISPTMILSARHCVDGLTAFPSLFEIGLDRDNDGQPESVLAVDVIEEIDAGQPYFDGGDIAFLSLASPAPAWAQPFRLFDGDPTGEIGTLVGYGNQGLGSTGATVFQAGTRLAARNVIDLFGPQGGDGLGANTLSTDFDDGGVAANTLAYVGSSARMLPREGTTAAGDSGGPLFVHIDGEPLIAGVLSGGTTANSVYGDISWWSAVGAHRSAIEARGGVFYTVPEPATWLLALPLLYAFRARGV